MCGEECFDDGRMMGIRRGETYMGSLHVIYAPWYDEEARHNMPSQPDNLISERYDKPRASPVVSFVSNEACQ
jgi:hypothetical protein